MKRRMAWTLVLVITCLAIPSVKAHTEQQVELTPASTSLGAGTDGILGGWVLDASTLITEPEPRRAWLEFQFEQASSLDRTVEIMPLEESEEISGLLLEAGVATERQELRCEGLLVPGETAARCDITRIVKAWSHGLAGRRLLMRIIGDTGSPWELIQAPVISMTLRERR